MTKHKVTLTNWPQSIHTPIDHNYITYCLGIRQQLTQQHEGDIIFRAELIYNLSLVHSQTFWITNLKFQSLVR